MDAYVRSYSVDLDVQGDGRTVVGTLAPYNEIAEVDDGFGPYYETFVPGCFRTVTKGRPQYLRVQLEHDGRWVGRGQTWLDTDLGLGAELRLDDTEAGREAAYKIRDGQTPGLSVSFVPGASPRERTKDGKWLVRRDRIKAIHHVALCPFPAYQQALVSSVRSGPAPSTTERLQYWKQWTERVRRV